MGSARRGPGYRAQGGRYDVEGGGIPGSNLPMAALGCLLIWFGLFGFNGGSTLAWNDTVPAILLNTFIAAIFGRIAATSLKFLQQKYLDVSHMINGLLGGLVVGVGDSVLNRLRIDDAVGVIPVHLFAGIWGTIAVALLADSQVLANGLTAMQQLQSQLVGIGTVGLYSFGMAYLLFRLINRCYPLRVNEQSELIGLNVTEHRVSTEVYDLLSTMHRQQGDADLSTRVPVEPFTEVGQIAQQYNRVIDKVNDKTQQRDDAYLAFKQSEYRTGAIVEAAMDCIVTINHRGDDPTI